MQEERRETERLFKEITVQVGAVCVGEGEELTPPSQREGEER
jgi:hypothetical protein